MSGVYESPYGEIRSEWKVQDGGRSLVHDVVVPANSEATLRLPAVSVDAVHDGRAPLARADGVRFIGYTDGVYACRLLSGRYRLTSQLR